MNLRNGDVVVWCGNDEFFGYLGEITNANSSIVDIYLGNHCNLRLICKHQQFKDIQVLDHIGE